MTILFLPEVILIFGICYILFIEIFGGKRREHFLITGVAVLLLTAIFELLILSATQIPLVFNGFTLDSFAVFFKIIILFLSLASVVLMRLRLFSVEECTVEALVANLSLTLVCLALVSVSDFVGLVSLLLIMTLAATLPRIARFRKLRELEAGGRSLMVSVLPAIIFVSLGLVVLSLRGNTGYGGLAWIEEFSSLGPAHVLGILVLVLCGASFFISSFPALFVFREASIGGSRLSWSFSLYMIPVTIFGVLVRLLGDWFFPSLVEIGGMVGFFGLSLWQNLILFLMMATTAVAALSLLKETSLRSLLGSLMTYHFGYLLVCFAAMSEKSVSAVLFGLAVDSLTFIMLFSAICRICPNETSLHLESSVRPKGIPLLTASVLLFALAGLPPFPGFITKFILLGSVFEAEMHGVVVYLIISQVFVAASLARFISRSISMADFEIETNRGRQKEIFIQCILVAPPVIATLFSSSILNFASHAYRFLLWS